MTIQTRLVEYTHDGQTFEGLLAWDDTLAGRRPAVAVAHAWAGRTEFEAGKARALAELGYVGFAMDVYGKGRRGRSRDENAALMTPLVQNRARLQARLGAALHALHAQPEVDVARCAAIGFCFGGLCVLDMARCGLPLRGVVSFHGLFTAPGNTAGCRIEAKVLALHGWDDPMVPPDAVLAWTREMTEAGADWQLHAYGGTMHAFTNPEANDPDFGTVYSARADARSWTAMRAFLSEVLA
ncbi:dienelactone hydrolase family protein [Tepidimonas charontis]|uniref:Dienelactone hydrolase family protein n=1 Tax=Tepidimonas charontis TaxID=2267262 RepID=A0A554XBA0_9BURK|nr:dienelactone hydrolase family protein [Tepidimonas charontis]TSE33110.1 Dienelactone hydrolase family protein [Tepidimonas charontis]